MTVEKMFLYECVEFIDTLNTKLYELSEKYECSFVPWSHYDLNNRYVFDVYIYFQTKTGELCIECENTEQFDHIYSINTYDEKNNKTVEFENISFDDLLNTVLRVIENNHKVFLNF